MVLQSQLAQKTLLKAKRKSGHETTFKRCTSCARIKNFTPKRGARCFTPLVEVKQRLTARTRIGWTKFRECGELLYGRKFSLKMKGRIYQSCVRSEMLYGSETWCLRENEMTILRRNEKAIRRPMCGVKIK